MSPEESVTADDLWRSICHEARVAATGDPLFGSSLPAAIFDHADLGGAVAYQIGEQLGRNTAERKRFAQVAREAFLASPDLVEAAGRDLHGIGLNDPAINGHLQLLLTKGYVALQVFRVSNWLWRNNRTDLALLLQSESSDRLQVSIHPSATIGTATFLDHATGIVVGSFAQIGDAVTILQNVTVGRTDGPAGRAPRIGRGVFLSSGATILGDISIGDFAKIGADAVVMDDVPAGCTAVGIPARLTNCPDDGGRVPELAC